MLRADSHHPPRLKKEIPVGQFLRIKRNCTKTSEFRKEKITCTIESVKLVRNNDMHPLLKQVLKDTEELKDGWRISVELRCKKKVKTVFYERMAIVCITQCFDQPSSI